MENEIHTQLTALPAVWGNFDSLVGQARRNMDSDLTGVAEQLAAVLAKHGFTPKDVARETNAHYCRVSR